MCSELDEAFNFWLEVFAFSECFKYESSWIKRINSIDDYWDTMLDSFDLDEFRIKFRRYCRQIYNTSGDEYDIQEGLKKAKSDLRIDLMTSVADEIAHTFIRCTSEKSTLVRWTGSVMLVDGYKGS